MDILNARVYKNIFENFEELIEKYSDLTDSEIRFFVLSFINFNLTHKIFRFHEYVYNNFNILLELPISFFNIENISLELLGKMDMGGTFDFKFELIDYIKSEIEIYYQKNHKSTENLKRYLNTIEEYSDDIWNYWKLDKILKFRENVSLERQKLIK